jgi:hypothetical protein
MVASQTQSPSDLSQRQLSKFKNLFEKKKIQNGKVYFPSNEMHGVLLTNSRQGAINIIKANERDLKPYLENFDDNQYIKHIGVDVLLDKLGEENPKKKTLYLATQAYIAGQLANDPDVGRDAAVAAAKIDEERMRAMRTVKQEATHCKLSGVAFGKGVDRCVHHIEGVSEQPSLAADPNNLIVLTKEVHQQYHSWVSENHLAVTRATLKQFAQQKGYNRNW